jgi:hypothetical protein
MRRDNYDVYSMDHNIKPFLAQQLDYRSVSLEVDVVWIRDDISGVGVDLVGERT